VQGVAWDPLDVYIASLSADRSVGIFKRSSQSKFHYAVDFLLKKRETSSGHYAYLFGDEKITTFYRRLCWSPDGQFLFTPCGILNEKNDKGENGLVYVTYVFSRSSLSAPCLVIPSHNKPSVAVRCNPKLFRKQESDCSIFDLPYRMIYAIATLSTVYIYDTEHFHPIAMFDDIHYIGLTDLAWSTDGYTLMISSLDGYCSMVYFNETDIGVTLDQPETDKIMTQLVQLEQKRNNTKDNRNPREEVHSLNQKYQPQT
jgi:chromatin assembly factor 1 subunit B